MRHVAAVVGGGGAAAMGIVASSTDAAAAAAAAIGTWCEPAAVLLPQRYAVPALDYYTSHDVVVASVAA